MIDKNKKLILFLDSGDTFIDESTEIYDEYGIVIKAKLIHGAKEFLEKIYKDGFIIALVADGNYKSFENVYKYYGLWDIFKEKIISSEVGKQKPNSIMFETAIKKLNLCEKDIKRIVMVGNNLRKDILGAKLFGIKSIWMNWSPRYFSMPRDKYEIADYSVKTPEQLLSLIYKLEDNLNKD